MPFETLIWDLECHHYDQWILFVVAQVAKKIFFLRDRLQVSLLILTEFKRINQLRLSGDFSGREVYWSVKIRLMLEAKIGDDNYMEWCWFHTTCETELNFNLLHVEIAK